MDGIIVLLMVIILIVMSKMDKNKKGA